MCVPLSFTDCGDNSQSRRLPKLFDERASVLRELERCVWRNARHAQRVRVWRGWRVLGALCNGEDAVQYWR